MNGEYNILVAGVGGLGILTATSIIAEAALIEGKNVMMSEIHGLSQRYGTVTATLRIGDNVHSPLIKRGSADLIIGLEPIETLRNIHMLRNNGYVIINLNPIPPPTVTTGHDTYPALNDILKALRKVTQKVIEVNALEIANRLGLPILQNTVLLGIAFKIPGFPVSEQSGKEAIRKVLAGKDKIIESNIKAFEEGLRIGTTIVSKSIQ